MIKRVHYKVDHGDQSGGSSSDSSSSDSGTESDADAPARPEQEEQVSESESESGGEQAVTLNTNPESDDEDEEQENERVKVEEFYQKQPSLHSPGSGYESEESSGNEVDEDSPGLVADMEEKKETKPIEKPKKGGLVKADTDKENSTGVEELDSCILKLKSVFKCKLCPRIICLSEKIVKQHLESKRHARSKKLFEGGRLKVQLNSDGELEEDYETHAERYARTLALAEEGPRVSKKDTGRQRQRIRRKKRAKNAAAEKAEQHTGSSKKKKQKKEK